MSRRALRHTANDNDPHDGRPEGDAAGFRGLLKDREMERRLQALEFAQFMQEGSEMPNIATNGAPHTTTAVNWGLITALLCTLAATGAAAYCFYAGQSLIISMIALIAMVWSALWAVYFSSGHKAGPAPQNTFPFIAEVSTIIATVAGLMIWVLTSREWGLPLSAADGAAGFAILSVTVSALLRSRLCLLMSACAGLVWLGLYTQIATINVISIWFYPVLALMQLFISGQDDAKLPAFLTLLGAHAWLFWILADRLFAGDIAMLQCAAITMMIGFAHYRLGKAAGDALWDNASLHIAFGWSLAVAGAVGLQIYWLGGDAAIWEDGLTSPLGDISWQIIGAISIALVGLAGVIRMAYKQMTSLAVLISLAVALAAAAVFDQRSVISNFVESELNMSATPLVGLVIGAAIFASSIAMSINGARRKNWLFMILGLAGIALQLTLLLDLRLWTLETSFAFAMCLVTSLCLAALFAADTTADYA